ncbi:hypothetical protein PanWU01x14_232150 [Parasponia andersonii]|uniref:Uncharacterized protein n=1 Tax=Parasponia andersonii TaxID=3476 RepID=A0A2P5BK17_PARAD|nr:hypothetical protein PanWU01x14_232150 [Parasponia andersonii]
MANVNRFKERALDCEDSVTEEQMIKMCIKRMDPECKIYVMGHVITNFADLMQTAKDIEETMAEVRKKDRVKSNSSAPNNAWNKSFLNKRKRKVSVVERPSINQQIPLEIPLDKKKLETLVKAWIEDGQLKECPVDKLPTQEEKRNPRYYLYHSKVAHSTTDYYAIRRLYHLKVSKGEIVKTRVRHQSFSKSWERISDDLHCYRNS